MLYVVVIEVQIGPTCSGGAFYCGYAGQGIRLMQRILKFRCQTGKPIKMFKYLALSVIVTSAICIGGCRKDDHTPAPTDRHEKIAFVAYQHLVGYTLSAMNGDGSQVKVLADLKWNESKPVASHKGDRILFYLQEDNYQSLYVVNKNGGDPVRLAVDAHGAAWSPDDSKIVFTRVKAVPGLTKLMLIDSEGGNERELVTLKALSAPAWFPVAKRYCLEETGHSIP